MIFCSREDWKTSSRTNKVVLGLLHIVPVWKRPVETRVFFISLHSKCLLFILSSFKSVNKNFECSDMKKYYGSEATKTGARNYARKFYSSKAWEKKSKAYRKSHPLCERCLKKGIYTRSTCVHHKIHIDQDNYRDIHILFGDSNLEALCDLCHAEEHSKRKPSFEFDENGMLIGCGKEDECKKEHGKKE